MMDYLNGVKGGGQWGGGADCLLSYKKVACPHLSKSYEWYSSKLEDMIYEVYLGELYG